MTGNISDIDYIAGSSGDQEGGITIYFKNGKELEANCIEFKWENGSFETS